MWRHMTQCRTVCIGSCDVTWLHTGQWLSCAHLLCFDSLRSTSNTRPSSPQLKSMCGESGSTASCVHMCMCAGCECVRMCMCECSCKCMSVDGRVWMCVFVRVCKHAWLMHLVCRVSVISHSLWSDHWSRGGHHKTTNLKEEKVKGRVRRMRDIKMTVL